MPKQQNPFDKCDTCDSLEVFKSQVTQAAHEQKNWTISAPPTSVELGNSGWTLLHTIAAYYPNEPTTQKQHEMMQFLKFFSKVYPCGHCAKDFEYFVEDHPPRLENQKEFSQWMCEAHNDVNRKLGKPVFDCSKVDQRWKRSRQLS